MRNIMSSEAKKVDKILLSPNACCVLETGIIIPNLVCSQNTEMENIVIGKENAHADKTGSRKRSEDEFRVTGKRDKSPKRKRNGGETGVKLLILIRVHYISN